MEFTEQGGKYIPFLRTCGTLTTRDQLPGHKVCLNQFQNIEIFKSVFLNHNNVKFDINNSKISGKTPNAWRLNSTLLNAQVKGEL